MEGKIEKTKFKVGDVVQLKSGGPLMTILREYEYISGSWQVGWMDIENHLQTTYVSEDAITFAFRPYVYDYPSIVGGSNTPNPSIPQFSYSSRFEKTFPLQSNASHATSVCQADGVGNETGDTTE